MVIKHWEGGRKTVDLYFVIILTNQDFSRGQLWWRCDFWLVTKFTLYNSMLNVYTHLAICVSVIYCIYSFNVTMQITQTISDVLASITCSIYRLYLWNLICLYLPIKWLQ